MCIGAPLRYTLCIHVYVSCMCIHGVQSVHNTGGVSYVPYSTGRDATVVSHGCSSSISNSVPLLGLRVLGLVARLNQIDIRTCTSDTAAFLHIYTHAW